MSPTSGDRVNCPRCGVVVEMVPPWAEANSGFTRDFEADLVEGEQRRRPWAPGHPCLVMHDREGDRRYTTMLGRLKGRDPHLEVLSLSVAGGEDPWCVHTAT